MKVSVASVTTAYNAERILPRQIDALLAQTRPLQEIVIVDNASTDGTCAMLAARYPQVTVVQTGKNLGAAGGWAAGLTYAALEKKYDWIWNFDNDSVPGTSTLEALLAGIETVQGDVKLGMAAPLPVNEATGIPYPPLLWREGYVKPSAELIREPIWFADLAIASGALIHRDTVAAIGLPRADLFMDFFDFEYCLRLRSAGYSIAVVTNCTFTHEIGSARNIRIGRWNRLWPDYPPWREYYLSRNLVYGGWHLYPTPGAKRFVTGHLLKHGMGVVLFGKTGKRIPALVKMVQGAKDGLRGKLGIRFLPGNVAS